MNYSCLKQSPRARVGLFIGLLGLCSGAAWFLALSKTSGPWSSLFVMWSPGLAAIFAGLILGRRISEVGWRPGNPKYLLAGWLLPIVAAGVVYGLAWVTGIGGVPSPLFLKRAAFTLHLSVETAPAEIIVRAFLYLAFFGLLNIGALGEELGWRGFLVPELNRWAGFRRAALVSGLLWALWHWPLVIWGEYSTRTPVPYALAFLTVMTVSTGIWQAWLRLKSGSLWPCFIMHSVHNAIIQKFFDRITIEREHTAYFTTEFGAGLAVVSLLIAIWFWTRPQPMPPLLHQSISGGLPSTAHGPMLGERLA